MLLSLCRQFGQLPSTVRAESTDLLRLMAIEAAGRREEEADRGQ